MICWFLAGCLVGGPIGFFGTRMALDWWENRLIEKRMSR